MMASMMDYLPNALNALTALLAAYLLGAIPFGLLIGKARGVDIRSVGSRNIGATNVFRCVGAKWGILAFLCDMLKGFGGVWCAAIPLLWSAPIPEPNALLLRVLCGTSAMLGHIFPVWLGFRGGKGISTALGLLIGVAPAAAGIGFGLWVVCFLLSRYVSLSSCLAAIVIGALVWTPLYADRPVWFAILMTILAALAILKHRANLVRLAKGTENRFAFTAKQRAARDAKKQEETP